MRDRAPRPQGELAQETAAGACGAGRGAARPVGSGPPCAFERDVFVAGDRRGRVLLTRRSRADARRGDDTVGGDVDGLVLEVLARARTQPRRRAATRTLSLTSVLRPTHRGLTHTDTIAADGAVSPLAPRHAFRARCARRRLQTAAGPRSLRSARLRARRPLLMTAPTSTRHSLPATWQSTAPTREDQSRQVEPHGDDSVNQIPIAPTGAHDSFRWIRTGDKRPLTDPPPRGATQNKPTRADTINPQEDSRP